MRPSDSLTSIGLGSGSPRLRPTSWRVASSSRILGCTLKTPGPSEFRLRDSVDRYHHEDTPGSPRLLGRPLRTCRGHLLPRRPYRHRRPWFGSRSCCLRALRDLGLCRDCPFDGCHTTAHTLAYLRVNAVVTDDAARLATGLPGSALAGRDLHPLDDYSGFQGGIDYLLSQLTSIAWSLPKEDKPRL